MMDLDLQPVAEYDGAATPGIDPSTLTVDQQLGYELMQGICGAMAPDVYPAVRAVQGPYLHIDIVGSTAEVWGRMGKSLDALQLLSNMILSRRVGSDVRLMLDADNYRARRTVALETYARDLASQVKAGNEEAELEPLPAHERRIIHSALVDDPDVTTYSEGDEPMRHIVIAPKR